MKKLPKKQADDENAWLITYADAVTLVLCFFIILFSVSEPKDSQFKRIAEAFQAAGFIETIEENPLEALQEQFQILIEDNDKEKEMSVTSDNDTLTLELSSSSFYHSGSSKFKREAIPILVDVAGILRDFNFDAYVIQIEGHTDDVPIKSQRYPSNWELAGGRAANVTRFFIAQNLNPELMRATSFAEVKPKVPNLDEDGTPIPENRDLNRRIVVQVERVDD